MTTIEKPKDVGTLFPVPYTFTQRDIMGLLCSALEGGMTAQWTGEVRRKLAKGVRGRDFENGGKYQPYDRDSWGNYAVPFAPGCALMVEHEDDEGKHGWLRLDLDAIRRGLELFVNHADYKHHFADLVRERTDEITGDVFLQFCLLGEIIYS